ncbi:hypothetical protein HYH03_007745 [Edaphochlamys debaryana]|uniref:Uncharacterized protein n=1 Tax=Edaphochlamys debaryana TaxID=47281 RepID=A0A835Y4Q0_9CHLO|nr:hypothetical protein HYH03_007745 [Edaphochlamys debaryana]|eukprot:KAG2494106.1 hypothetical protein HYH03_007745 [Edaphochlamys debaryana]
MPRQSRHRALAALLLPLLSTCVTALQPRQDQSIAVKSRPDSDLFLYRPDTRGEYIRRVNQLPTIYVIPSDEEVRAASRAIATVARVLYGVPRVRVDRVHVGGSFGRKTSVKGRFDVDLSVFVNRFNPERDPKGAAEALEAAALQLEQHTGVNVTRRPGVYMVQLTWEGVHMDVPLVRNVATDEDTDKAARQVEVLVSPLFRMTDAEIAAMAAKPPDGMRERAVSEALTDFVKEQPKTANEATRLFKAWVKCGLAERGLLRSSKLPSVALELIVLQAFQAEQAAPSHDFDPIRPERSLLIRVFLRALNTAAQLDGPCGSVVMLDAGALGYRREQGERFRACWGAEGPFIIHPIDPTCNVAQDPGDGHPPWDWPSLAREARALLAGLRNASLEVLLHGSSLGAALERLQG